MRLLASLLLLVGAATLHADVGPFFFIKPSADAFVATGANGSLAANNYGGAGALAVAAPGLPKGEMQMVLQFDLSEMANALNHAYGAGQWSVVNMTLQLTEAAANNPLFNAQAAGEVGVSWMQNDSWTEGTGTPGAPGSAGITFSSLNGFIGPNDQTMMFSLSGLPAGGQVGLGLGPPGMYEDALAGDKLSMRLFGADDKVSHVFNSRNFSSPDSQPVLFIAVVPEPGVAATVGLLGLLAFGGRWVWRGLAKRTSRGRESMPMPF